MLRNFLLWLLCFFILTHNSIFCRIFAFRLHSTFSFKIQPFFFLFFYLICLVLFFLCLFFFSFIFDKKTIDKLPALIMQLSELQEIKSDKIQQTKRTKRKELYYVFCILEQGEVREENCKRFNVDCCISQVVKLSANIFCYFHAIFWSLFFIFEWNIKKFKQATTSFSGQLERVNLILLYLGCWLNDEFSWISAEKKRILGILISIKLWNSFLLFNLQKILINFKYDWMMVVVVGGFINKF